MEELYSNLVQILKEDNIRRNERMENHTSLRIGGEADYFVTPSTSDEITAIINLCKIKSIPYYIMGNGSNLLVSDKGFRGLIIKLAEDFSEFNVDDDGLVTAKAGILLSKLANTVARKGFTGFEFAAGIPGTLGGAIVMNAGAYDGELKQCIVKAKVIDDEGRIVELNKEELELGYRSSIIQRKELVVIEAVLKLEKGITDDIIKKICYLNSLRREKQPLEQLSAGSTFKRPVGYYAGKLISDAGLRGFQIGQAAVSEKHCGFVINKGNATAKDFMAVITEVKRIVYDKYGVALEPEVKFLGDIS